MRLLAAPEMMADIDDGDARVAAITAPPDSLDATDETESERTCERDEGRTAGRAACRSPGVVIMNWWSEFVGEGGVDEAVETEDELVAEVEVEEA